ncbi:MAG TPA: DUF2341 domain-containing protein [Archaeoglobus profundus]|nr:DUF2341 domain-containing protein [Archaeoglobus profundus]
MNKRGVSPIIGFILIVQILIIFYTLVQTVLIPDQLKRIEADNVENLKGEIEKFAALTRSGERACIFVSPPKYPHYLFLMTPEPIGISVYSEKFTVTLSYTEILPNGTSISVNKRFENSRIFVRIKNYYYPSITFIFENGIVFQKQGDTIIPIGEQNLINNWLNLVIIEGNFSFAFNTPKELAFDAVSVGGLVYGKNISLTFESVNPEFWRKYGNANGISVTRNDSRITINIPSGLIRINVYSIEGNYVDRKPYRILKLNPFDEYTIFIGETKEFGIVILDRFNNPVAGERVKISAEGGIGKVDGLNEVIKVSDSTGRVYVSFKATATGRGKVVFQLGNLKVNYSVNVVSPRIVLGVSLVNVEWLNKSTLDSNYGNVWDAYFDRVKDLKVRVYDQDNQPIPNINVRFVVTNSSVIELDSTISTTNSDGIASVRAFSLVNGSTKIFAFAGDSGDVLNLTIVNVTIPWLKGWRYRVPIFVEERSGNLLTDYQILVTLDRNFNWSAVKRDGSDIRFVDTYGNELSYWIEEWNYGSSAKIWVNVSIIPKYKNITIYMYYGNSSAESKSDGFRTFIFFDDFDDGDISDWRSVYAYISATTFKGRKVLRLDPYWSPNYYQHFAVPQNLNLNLDTYVVGAYIYDRWPAGSLLFHYVDDGNWWSLELYYGGNKDIFRPYIDGKDKGWVYIRTPCSIKAREWYKIEVVAKPDSFKMFINGELKWDKIVEPKYRLTGYTKVGFVEHRGFGPLYADYIYVRKYVEPEPKVTIGQEERIS